MLDAGTAKFWRRVFHFPPRSLSIAGTTEIGNPIRPHIFMPEHHKVVEFSLDGRHERRFEGRFLFHVVSAQFGPIVVVHVSGTRNGTLCRFNSSCTRFACSRSGISPTTSSWFVMRSTIPFDVSLHAIQPTFVSSHQLRYLGQY